MKEKLENHENPYIKKLYADYLGAVMAKKRINLLHTHYEQKSLWKIPEEALNKLMKNMNLVSRVVSETEDSYEEGPGGTGL